MTWVAVATAGAGLLGGLLNKKSGDKAAQTSERMSEADRQFTRDMYDKTLQANRPNQQSDFGALTWAKDANGNWTQQNRLNPAEAARLEDFRQVAADRMAAAKGGYKTDWNSLGFGKLANATLGQAGDTGQRSWANQRMASTANDFMRNGQAPPNMATQMGIPHQPTPPPMGQTSGVPPSAGGSFLQTGTPIAPGYQPGSQMAPPAEIAPNPAAAAEHQQLAEALRRKQQQEIPMDFTAGGGNSGGGA